jgi:uncharacterized damage-inducible protein DinB
MTEREALDLFEYNSWANARLLQCCAELSPDQWSRDLGGSFPTVLSVVAHIVGAEWIWLRRCRGESPTTAPDWFGNPSPAALVKALEQVEADRLKFLLSLTNEDLEKEVRYSLLDGSKGVLPLATLLRHVMNHSLAHIHAEAQDRSDMGWSYVLDFQRKPRCRFSTNSAGTLIGRLRLPRRGMTQAPSAGGSRRNIEIVGSFNLNRAQRLRGSRLPHSGEPCR